MTVHFIGAGPGAADLITVRGLRLIETCPVCIYAGSLVPKEVVTSAPKGALLIDSSSLTLDEIIAAMVSAHDKGHDIARVHSGDPSIYGAMAEQMRRLDTLDIPYDVTPGVPAFVAAAAAMKQELTIPEVNQSIILTRTSVKSSAMPVGEDLATFAKSGATLVIHLSIRNIAKIEVELTPFYGADCPVVVAYRIGWPDEQILRGKLSDIAEKIELSGIKRTAMIFVGRGLDPKNFRDSALYHEAHNHVARLKS
ncbi:precorrin-4 C(11)-methyltransferase [Brucella gallinifaecis]|uniref:Precorrin-4 C(11)-methyltransferase n=1 Tax=Brucella gallinifaecis TaxID=215590 RepID=A0A502BMA5_9HYPH|nr:precorrin-4 C(11)-methyltransferase [Brucella gallinifaecis]TPF75612.1 precorrin-4 C(11)-methyltransferase [Brucella gallinifaecis]